MELKELKEGFEAMGTAFEEFKKANDLRLKQIEEKGGADPLIEEKLQKINADMDAKQELIDNVQATLKRIAQSSEGGQEGKETAEMREYKKGFNKFLRKGHEDGLLDLQRKALSVDSDPDGGYVVIPEMDMTILRNLAETTPMRSRASVQTISSDALEQPKRTSGATSGGWVGETASRTETTNPKLGLLRIEAHEQYVEPAATQKFLDDSAINVEQWLSDEIAETIALTENTAFITGDGIAKPRGILTFTAGTGAGQIEQVNSGHASQVTADGLISLQTALKEGYQVNASWFMTRATVGLIRKLKGSDNNYLWQPGLSASEPAMLLGRPYDMASDMPEVAANALALAYGDFRRGYKIVDRTGVRILRDPYSSKPLVLFYATKRTGGDVTIHEAIKIQKIAA